MEGYVFIGFLFVIIAAVFWYRYELHRSNSLADYIDKRKKDIFSGKE